jgi:hypothetical protein
VIPRPVGTLVPPPDRDPPFQPGDTVSYWTRAKGEIRSTLVVAEVVELSADWSTAWVIRRDAVAPFREVAVKRLRKVGPAEAAVRRERYEP